MSRTMLASFTGALLIAMAMSGPAHALGVPCVKDFQDQTVQGFGPSPGGPNLTVGTGTPGASGMANDYYLRVEDGNGDSALAAPHSCDGDWLEYVRKNHGCLQYCFDVRVFSDGRDNATDPFTPSFTIYYNGPKGQFSATFTASFTLNENMGFNRVCAPLDELTPDNQLPTGGAGSWKMNNGAPNSEWNTLLSGIVDIRFGIEINTYSEILGFDNVGLTVTPSCSTTIVKKWVNSTGDAVNSFEWLVKGTYDSVNSHFDGPYQGQPGTAFSRFEIVPSGPNTLFRWSGRRTSIPAGETAHVGLDVQGHTLTTLSTGMATDGLVEGCTPQIAIGTASSHPHVDNGTLVVANTATNCNSATLYTGHYTLKWLDHEVQLADLAQEVEDLEALRTDNLDQMGLGGIVEVDPEMEAEIQIPDAPANATHLVVISQVADNPDLTNASTDYAQIVLITNEGEGLPIGPPPDEGGGARLMKPKKKHRSWAWEMLASLFALGGVSMVAVHRRRSRANG